MRQIKHGKLASGCADACCLKLTDLSVSMQGEAILQDVAFHLHCGEIVALIGPNGAGKSTLFRSILGQLPYRGTITFSPAGGPAIRLSDGPVTGGKRPLVGYVPQAPSFDRGDPVSVLDFFVAATAKWPVWLPIPRKYREQAAASLARVHGEELLDRPMGGLSGGQLQRVCIARAVACEPEIILFDEAISSLDAHTQVQVMDLLIDLKEKLNLTYVFITHDLTSVTYLCDEVLFLYRGHITECRPVRELGKTTDEYARRLLQAIV